MMHKIHSIFLLLLMLCMASCDRSLSDDNEELSLSLDKITFSEDYKTFTIEGSLVSDSLRYDLCDSMHTTLQVYACGDYLDTLPAKATPLIKEVRNIGKEQLSELEMQALVIVDRTMAQPLVDEARNIVNQLCRFLDPTAIYVSFLDGQGKASAIEPLDPGQMMQDFISSSIDGLDKYLYRDVYNKLQEVTSDSSPLSGKNRFILVVTDGIVWDEDQPFDPEHFTWQKELLDLAESTGEKCPVFYSLMSDEFGVPLEVNNTMKMVCERTQGVCVEITDPDAIHEALCEVHYLPHIDYQFLLECPDNRVMRGEHIHLHLTAMQDGELRMHGTIGHQNGSWFNPIIINGVNNKDLVFRCILVWLLLSLIVYLIMQLLVPYILNKLFERKYMAEYKGPNMSIAGHQVPEVCYFCKTPFQTGDKIVASCEHAMHQECWEENNYRCPEHGITCHEKHIHYANPKKRFAQDNAPFYMKWVLVALLANIVRFVLVQLMSGDAQKSVLYFFLDLLLSDEMAEMATAFCFRNPHNSGIMAMCIVAAIAYMCRSRVHVRQQITGIVLRSVVAYLVGYALVLLDITVCTLLDIKVYHDLIGIISYLLVLLSVYIIVSYRSPIRLDLNKMMIVGGLFIASGYLLIHNFYFDQRDLYFYLIGLFYVAIAVSVAFDTKRIWHCFLRIEGSMKKIEVALFKWILARPNVPVTLGRSVDCTMQLVWDVKNKIAPVQAEIREYHGNLCLFPTEEGVLDQQDIPLPIEKPVKLYHGTRFKIGDLIFTYLEKY